MIISTTVTNKLNLSIPTIVEISIITAPMIIANMVNGIDIKGWKTIMDIGVEKYNLAYDQFMPTDRTDPFFASDQDALNMAIMSSKFPISELGPEAMDFIHGGWTMSHAVGSPKPWKKNFMMSALKGLTPSLADRAFWLHVNGPIKFYSPSYILFKKSCILMATLICRFYKRN